MKCLLSIILLSVATAMAYEDINDKNVVTILQDNKLFGEVFGCLVDVNSCDDFGAHIKSHVGEILKDSCRECDYTQKHYTHATLTKLKNEFPELYEKYEAKYDPSRTLLKGAIGKKCRN